MPKYLFDCSCNVGLFDRREWQGIVSAETPEEALAYVRGQVAIKESEYDVTIQFKLVKEI
jgi:hypothetical protein